MKVRVGVLARLPLFRGGLCHALGQAGYRTETPADPRTWIRVGNRALVLVVETGDDLQLLADVCDTAPVPCVVALPVDPDPDAHAELLAAGAMAVVPASATPDCVVRALETALGGLATMPIDVARQLAVLAEHDIGRDELGDGERAWLRKLAGGCTVPQLADACGYSEREMYRRLAGLYRRMGARNRTHALVCAARWGLLDEAL